MQAQIDSGAPFAVGYADLDKFKVYNDIYGFEKGDDVIREMARILIKNVRSTTADKGFVGHIGGDDFVFIVDDAVIDKICKNIIKDFEEKVPSFYNKEDISKGYIIGRDRQGNEQK
ncbi:MAG: diguanylate cyclase response regulator, partial [Phototrophicales bacterium]